MIVLACGVILAGIGIGCVETAEHATVAELAPEQLRGSAFGLLATTQSLGNFVASSIAGIRVHGHDFRWFTRGLRPEKPDGR